MNLCDTSSGNVYKRYPTVFKLLKAPNSLYISVSFSYIATLRIFAETINLLALSRLLLLLLLFYKEKMWIKTVFIS